MTKAEALAQNENPEVNFFKSIFEDGVFLVNFVPINDLRSLEM